MEQVAKLKRNWYLAPVLQIIQKLLENYCSCLYLSIGQVWLLSELSLKRLIQKCTLFHVLIIHHDATNLVNREKVENTKIYHLDPVKFPLAPGLTWEVASKKTEVKSKLLTDIDIKTLLIVEKCIRGGICHTIYQYAKANNKYDERLL